MIERTDHFPTRIEIAGAPLRPKQHVDGRSYVKAIRISATECLGSNGKHAPIAPVTLAQSSHIEGSFKIVQWIDQDLVELFDLSNDISKQTNLASQMPDRTTAMLAKLNEFETSVGNLRKKGRKELQRRLSRVAKKAKN